MNKTFIAIHTNTFFVEPFKLVKLLQQSKDYFPVVCFVAPYPTWADDAVKCISLGVPCLDSHGKSVLTDNLGMLSSKTKGQEKILDNQKRGFIYNLLKKVLFKVANNHLVGIAREYLYFQKRFKFVKEIFEEQKPSLLILGGDMVGYDTSVFINVAHKDRLPVLILPSTMSNGLEQAEAYYHDPRYRVTGLVNSLAAKLYPKWLFEHRGRKLLRVPGERVIVMEYLKLAPPTPWAFNSGFADAIVVESEQMMKYYQDCDLPDNQLRLVGSLADDEMFSVLKNRDANKKSLCKDLGISADKPILLTALPPDFLYLVGGRPECDFADYRELVRFWVQSIIAHAGGYNVVICLHPSVQYEDFKYIEDWGGKIARKGTAELIPLCDIYVASVSSTIRWAIACGIPVINYDVYRYHYTDYKHVEGVITVEEKSEFVESLHNLSNNAGYYLEIKRLQEIVSSGWGNLDGKAKERLMQLLSRLINVYQSGECSHEQPG